MYTSALFHRFPPSTRLSLLEQVEKGVLVCPLSKQPLQFSTDKKALQTPDREVSYALNDAGVPLLLPNLAQAHAYAEASVQMTDEYQAFTRNSLLHRCKYQLTRWLNASWQSPASIAAHARTYNLAGKGLCLSVGGGPTRSHPRAINLNISAFANVDIVADASRLPFADNSIDSSLCEDVLEHIEQPEQVVREIHRTLKVGGLVYSTIPFLISYHGYPFHFQNFTHQGHCALYSRQGFKIVDYGVCMGGWTAWLNLVGFLLARFTPRRFGIRSVLCKGWTVFAAISKPLDRLFQLSPHAAEVAFSTFVLAEKIGPSADSGS